MPEYLKRISVKGYKSLGSVSLDFRPITVLIGANGSGKTNFLSVFRLLQAVFSGHLAEFGLRSDASTLFYNGLKNTEAIELGVTAEDAVYEASLSVTDSGRLFLQQERLTDADASVKYSASAMPESGLQRRQVDAMPALSSCRLLQLQNWKVHHFNDTSRSARIRQKHAVVDCECLKEDGANLVPFLYRLKQHWKAEYADIVRAMQRIAPYFEDFVLEPEESNEELIQLKWHQKGCDELLGMSQLSDGTLRFLCLATLFLQPETLMPAVLVADEPELGLHPFALTVFSELVRRAAVSHQVVISTQSAEMLNEFFVEEVVVVDRGQSGTVMKRLQEKELADWLQEDYSLSELWQKNVFGGRLSR